MHADHGFHFDHASGDLDEAQSQGVELGDAPNCLLVQWTIRVAKVLIFARSAAAFRAIWSLGVSLEIRSWSAPTDRSGSDGVSLQSPDRATTRSPSSATLCAASRHIERFGIDSRRPHISQ